MSWLKVVANGWWWLVAVDPSMIDDGFLNGELVLLVNH